MKFQKYQLVGLREEIKGLAARGREYNARIRGSSGAERHALRVEKSGVGYSARVCLLAYALLRGLPYRAQEPSGGVLRSHLLDAVEESAKRHVPSGSPPSEESILAWVSAAPLVEAAQ